MTDEDLIDAITHHLQTAPKSFPGGPVPHVICEDGTHISIQAGPYMHSSPRDDTGPWTHLEVMVENPLHLTVNESNISSMTPMEDLLQEIRLHSPRNGEIAFEDAPEGYISRQDKAYQDILSLLK